MPAAIIFDLDGVLLDSEQRWNEAKEALVREAGGTWLEESPTVMMGMGLPDDNLHAPNEKFHIPNFYRGIEAIIRFFTIVGESK